MQTYRSASRGSVPLADMHDAHLSNAIAKLERASGRERDPAALHALKAERARRAQA